MIIRPRLISFSLRRQSDCKIDFRFVKRGILHYIA